MSLVEARVSSLHFYPVKSCGETELQTAQVTEKGIAYDRHWMLVDANGQFLSQRDFPKMSLIKPVLNEDRIVIATPDEPAILELPLDNDGARKRVQIWKDNVEAIDDGDISAQWFSDTLKTECRLVHLPDDSVREKKPDYGRLEFADSYPFLIVSEESLQDLNKKIEANGGQSIPMNRFRPNIVVSGCEPYSEDEWKQIEINGVKFDVVKPCIRCPIPQIDQATAVKGKEPTKTLLSYRRISRTEVIFAQKAVNLNSGSVFIGDNIEVLDTKPKPEFV